MRHWPIAPHAAPKKLSAEVAEKGHKTAEHA